MLAVVATPGLVVLLAVYFFYSILYLFLWSPYLLAGLWPYLLIVRLIPAGASRWRASALALSPLTVLPVIAYEHAQEFGFDLDVLIPGLLLGAAIFGMTVREPDQ